MKENKETRPWGEFSVLHEGEGFKVKSIVVEPGKRLSMQYHDHRAERWIVVRGVASVLNAPLGKERTTEEIVLSVGQQLYIEKGRVHRLTNAGEGQLELIEVQLGDDLREDDITRLSDDFGRAGER